MMKTPRKWILLALGAYLLVVAVRELRVQLSVQPRMIATMAKSLHDPPPRGVMCASKPHMPRLLGMKFLPLRQNWDMDSVRAHGADYVFLGWREMSTRPQFVRYTQPGAMPPWARIIAYWAQWETVIIQFDRPPATAATDSLTN
jgi:hypothetical protein